MKDRLAALEKPHREALKLAQVKSKFPDAIYQAAAKPESERTDGEKLLATQLFDMTRIESDEVDKVLSPQELATKKDLTAQIAALEQERPAKLPMADIVTDGDYRFAPPGPGDELVGCPKCRIPPPFPGSFLHTGPDRYETPPSHFLVRGDPALPGAEMKPEFVQVITSGNPPTAIPRPDGSTSGRRLALARWITSPQNPMTARVIVNRLWQKHFGRGIVSTLDNFGRMGEMPTHPELLDWLAVELVNRGWRLKAINKLMMMSESYQMASSFDHAASAAADPENRLLWRFRPQRLDAEMVRDCLLAAGGNLNPAWAARRSSRSSRRTSCSASRAASGRTRPTVPARGAAASTSTAGGRCPTRCSTRSTIPI